MCKQAECTKSNGNIAHDLVCRVFMAINMSVVFLVGSFKANIGTNI